jgi:3-isopropylmalate dehydrogenase
MKNLLKIAVLNGDGVGPEVIDAATSVLQGVGDYFEFELELTGALVGGAAIRETGDPLPEATIEVCMANDAVLLGAVGSPEFDTLLPDKRPEKGLLRLRQALGGFANLRPARAIDSLLAGSPLRAEVFAGTDLLIVRELLGGLYFAEPRGFSNDNSFAFNTLRYSKDEIIRVARVAFDSARSRRSKVTSVDKANVLECSRLWRSTVEEVASEYPDVELDHLYIDACAMHLVTDPSRFDVILTDNLFGDILSDESAVLTGSLGMLASATIGGAIDLFEPIHGSAPDIAGQGIANPLGAIASVAMMLRHTFKLENAAAAIESGIEAALETGYRTVDIAEGSNSVSTEEMASAVLEKAIENAGISHAFHAV